MAREFYCAFLGLREIPKPEKLRARGGFWAQLGATQIHFGVEDGIERAATRAHLAYEVADLAHWDARLRARGIETKAGDPVPGMVRFEFRDPFGNRIEMLERRDLGDVEKPEGLKAGWRRLGTTYLYESTWYDVRQDIIEVNGQTRGYTWIEHPGAVFAVPVTRDGRMVLIRTFRYLSDEWCWEVPAGGIGDKRGASLEEIAREEMAEEAGCTGGTLEFMGAYSSANGALDLRVHYYLARDVTPTGELHAEDLETISEVRAVPAREALEWALTGKVRDGDSAFAILLAAQRLGVR